MCDSGLIRLREQQDDEGFALVVEIPRLPASFKRNVLMMPRFDRLSSKAAAGVSEPVHARLEG